MNGGHFSSNVVGLAIQSCSTPCDPMDCSTQAPLSMDTGVGCHTLLQSTFLTQGWRLRLSHRPGASLPGSPSIVCSHSICAASSWQVQETNSEPNPSRQGGSLSTGGAPSSVRESWDLCMCSLQFRFY